MTLELGDPWHPWHPGVRRGTLHTAQGRRPVLAIVDEAADAGIARQQARPWLLARADAVLPLLEVVETPEGTAWVYAGEEVVAVRHLAGPPPLGHRAVAEVGAAVAEALGAHDHPGPGLDDVLVTRDGAVRIANFTPRRPLPPVVGDPSDPEAVTVYRIGLVMAHLLGGAPGLAGTHDAHEAALRRTVIRAMSRPGAVLSDAYGNWLRALLAWDPAARPPLSRVAAGLRELVATTPGESLEQAARRDFSSWILGVHGMEPSPHTLPADLTTLRELDRPEPTLESRPGMRTLEDEGVLGDFDAEDDPTVDSELGVPPPAIERTPPKVERGSIPVAVGPPAEVAARKPRLPEGFLTDATETQHAARPVQRPPRWVVPVAVGLGVILVGLGVWLALA